MGSMSVWHWIIVLAVGLLLFGGRGKISDLMGDFAKGIKSFKKGLAERKARGAGQDRPDENHRAVVYRRAGCWQRSRVGRAAQGRLTPAASPRATAACGAGAPVLALVFAWE